MSIKVTDLMVVGHWNRFPREVVMALSLSKFEKCLGNALGCGVTFFDVVLSGARSWT